MSVGEVGYNFLMTSRQTLHAVIDTLNDEVVEDLLERVKDEQSRDVPALTPQALASILRGLQEASEGRGIPHEEAMRLVGLD